MGLCFDKGAVQVECNPWVGPVDVAADDVGMVDRYEAVLIEKAFAFSPQVGEQRFDLAPIAFAAANAGRTVDDVYGSGQVYGCRVQFMIDQRGRRTLDGRYA